MSFDVPFPANYGGVIDVYYTLVWLKRAGVKVHLHCFTYGRKPAPELAEVCENVYYYQRQTGLLANLSLLPYTVKSRQSKELEKNLLANNYPILFEVLHTCYLLNDKRFQNRKKIYRHSNIEHTYYSELSKSERHFVKRLYLKIEAKKLKRFEKIINFADVILAVNQKDTSYFTTTYPKVKTLYLPSFHANSTVTSLIGKGNFILFHGNLAISENYEAALWLIETVFSKISLPIIVAGLNPPLFLKEKLKKHKHIQLIISPTESEMTNLIHDAQIHVLYTQQPTGLKLKLLNVLFKGRFVLCNSNMTGGTGFVENSSFVLANEPHEFIEKINLLFFTEFSEANLQMRKKMVVNFENETNCKLLLKELEG